MMSKEYQVKDNYTGFKASLTQDQVKGVKFEGDGSIFIGELPFISPKQIVEYTCSNCSEVHTDTPNITVEIHNQRRVEFSYYAECGDCGKIAFGGHLKSLDGVDSQYIKLDETGDYIIPTTESIESKLTEARGLAGEVKGNYEHHLDVAKTWAGKIGYQGVDDQVTEIKAVYEDAYLRKFERDLPDTLDAILHEDPWIAWHFSDDDDGPESHFEVYLSEQMSALLEALPKINVPNDSYIRKGLFRVLTLYEGMCGEGVENKEGEREEFLKKIDETLANRRSWLSDAKLTRHQFAEKVGLTDEEKTESKNVVSRKGNDHWM
jgi:hypothetical protein